MIEINKQVKYAEAQIIFKKQDGLYGYQFKDGRLYDKTFKDEEAIRTSKIYNSYLNQEEYYSTDVDFDIVTLKESCYYLKVISPFLGPQPLGAIAYYFKEKQENIDYEILKVFSYILSEYIKRQIERENLELDEKLKDFYLSKEKSGYIKIIDNVLFLNDVARNILDVNINILRLDEYYELIGSVSKPEFKGIIEKLTTGNLKSANIRYRLMIRD